jgi:hypothetical protein
MLCTILDDRFHRNYCCESLKICIINLIDLFKHYRSLLVNDLFGSKRYEVLTSVLIKGSIFCDLTPSSPTKVNRCFGGTYRIHLRSRRITAWRWQQAECTLKMDATYSSEITVDFYPTTRRLIPEAGTVLLQWICSSSSWPAQKISRKNPTFLQLFQSLWWKVKFSLCLTDYVY